MAPNESSVREGLLFWTDRAVAENYTYPELTPYCAASVGYIFGERTGDPIADRILQALDEQKPLVRSTISGLFDRHVDKTRIEQALSLLKQAQLIREEQQKTKEISTFHRI